MPDPPPVAFQPFCHASRSHPGTGLLCPDETMRAYLDLTNRGQAQRIRLLARQAVEAFGLVDARLDLLDHAENTTFRVTAPQGRYVLRVHRPGYRSPAEIQSELWWLDALTREAGLRVPRPQRTPDGRWLVQCQVPGVPEPRDCVLFEWLDGRMMRKRRSPAYFRKVGALTARLHLHAAAWRPPIGFERQAWDAEGLVGDSPLWGSATDLPGLSPLQIARFEEAASLVADRLDAFGTAPDRFGLIHADLHYGNVMTHGGDVFAIDFDDSGEGWFLYDMAVTLKVVRQKPEYGAARAAWLRGYRAVRPLADEHLALLDTLMLARTICQAQWVASRRDNPRIRKYAPIMRDQVLSFADLALGA